MLPRIEQTLIANGWTRDEHDKNVFSKQRTPAYMSIVEFGPIGLTSTNYTVRRQYQVGTSTTISATRRNTKILHTNILQLIDDSKCNYVHGLVQYHCELYCLDCTNKKELVLALEPELSQIHGFVGSHSSQGGACIVMVENANIVELALEKYKTAGCPNCTVVVEYFGSATQ